MRQLDSTWQEYPEEEFPLTIADLREWTSLFLPRRSVGQPGLSINHPYGNWFSTRFPDWWCEEVIIRPLDENERMQGTEESHPIDCAFIRMMQSTSAGIKHYRDYDLPDWAILLEEQMTFRCNIRTCHLQAVQLTTLLKKRPPGKRVPAAMSQAPFAVFDDGKRQGLYWNSAYLADIRLAISEHIAQYSRNFPFVDPRFISQWLAKFGILRLSPLLFPPTLFQEESEGSPWVVSWPVRVYHAHS